MIFSIMFISCNSDSHTGSNINKPFLLFPVNGFMTSSNYLLFQFRHTNDDIDGIYYEFILSNTKDFSNIIYFESNIYPYLDSFNIELKNAFPAGRIYYYKAIARGINDEDYAVSDVYSIYIEDIGHNNPDHFLSVGDSITMSDFPGQNYSDFLRDLLISSFGSSVHTINAGIPGLFGFELLNLIDMFLYFNAPAYSIILIGINDIRHPGVCPEPYNCRTLQEIIDISLSCMDNHTIPFIATLLPAVGYAGIEYDDAIREFNNQLKLLAVYYKIEYIDLYDAFLKYEGNMNDLYADDIHPNIKGNEYMASIIHKYIMNRTYNIQDSNMMQRIDLKPEQKNDLPEAMKINKKDELYKKSNHFYQ